MPPKNPAEQDQLTNKTELESIKEAQPEKVSIIPAQYKDLPSEVAEELWLPTEFINEEKDVAEKERRTRALAEIKQIETERESLQAESDGEKYALLSEDAKKEFPNLQHSAVQTVAEYIKGTSPIPEELSSAEAFILEKAKGVYNAAREKDPNTPLTLEFSRDIDKKIYANLLNKLAFRGIKASTKNKEQQQINDIRSKLGIPTQPTPAQDVLKAQPSEKVESGPGSKDAEALSQLSEFLDKRLKKKPEFKDAFHKILEDLKKSGDEEKVAGLLMSEFALNKRLSDYPPDLNYNKAWEYVTSNNDLTSRLQKDWMYRGIMPSSSEGTKTETRGSLNVNVTPEVVKSLDDLIKKGIIKANYKFGHPDSGASGFDRHDAITIYFLEKPSQEALDAISKIAKNNLRGNDLIGTKISEGFYMSDIGSVKDEHAENLINQVEKKNGKLGNAVRGYLTQAPTGKGKDRVAMSEVQYYSVKNALNTYGYDIDYDGEKGLALKELK